MTARASLPPPEHVGFVDTPEPAGTHAQALAGLPGSLPGLSAGRLPGQGTSQTSAPGNAAPTVAVPKSQPATETLAKRAGAFINEVDFPGFVAQLVHGTFDAIVDASIRLELTLFHGHLIVKSRRSPRCRNITYPSRRIQRNFANR